MFAYVLTPYLITYNNGSQTVLLARNETEAETLAIRAGNSLTVVTVTPLPDR